MIGLIAVHNEAHALLKSITVEATSAQSQARLYRGTLAGRPVVLATVGPGKVQTAAVTQHLIDHYAATLVISCGSAGALAAHLQVGDVVLADEVTQHDAGFFGPDGFEYIGLYDNAHPGALRYHRTLRADPTLLLAAQQAAAQVTWPQASPQIETGCLVSGDQVIVSDTKKQWLRHTFNALAVDMESAAMAHVAVLNHIPWLAVRAISDRADSTLDIALKTFITYSDDTNPTLTRIRQIWPRITGIALKPGQLKTMLVFRQAMRHAAANAANVTEAIIAQFD